MRWLVLLIVDSALMVLATLSALVLRENFEVSAGRLMALLPYLIATAAMALAVFPVAGLNRSVWRFSSFHDYLRVTLAVAAVVAGAVGAGFAYNRLDGVARSLPFLQFLTATAFLSGARVLHKLGHELKQHRKTAAKLLRPETGKSAAQTVLIVGFSRLAEAYLQAVAELAPTQVKIAGLAGGAERQAGRLVATYPVLGRPEDLGAILDKLEVHGVLVDRIVVAADFHALSLEAQEALLMAERARDIALCFLAEDWGLGFKRPRPAEGGQERSAAPAEQIAAPAFEIPAPVLARIAKRRYWAVKRAMDLLGAAVLLLLLFPLILLTALAVAVSLGDPVLFWQQRPGLGGRPFRLYKFRTMRAAHSGCGRRLSDRERVSRLGTALRRLRFDELPQLFNILRGDMSFAGPRPLLPRDQSGAYRTRLLVRPGLTGWAQVIGGRDIAPVDKAALDTWYVCNASFALDLEISLRTLPVLLFGDRVSEVAIKRAWRDLSSGGVPRGQLGFKEENGLRIIRGGV